MKKHLWILSIILLGHGGTIAQTKNFIDKPYLETTASVDTLVKPDIIYLDILIREGDDKNRTSVEVLEGKMAVQLESLGIDLQKQLTIEDLSSNFKKYFLKQKDIVKSKAYSLKVFDAMTAGNVMVQLENIGISNVSLNKTEYSKMDQLKLILKSKAVSQAKKQAEYLLEPLGQITTKALFITDKYYQGVNNNGYVVTRPVAYSVRKKKEVERIVEIEFKPILIKSEVTVRFGIE